MDILLSKILTYLAMPLGTAALLTALGLTSLLVQRLGLAAALMMAGLVWVCLWSVPLFSDWIRGSLEDRFPSVPIEAIPSADAIVVLGGGVDVPFAPRSYPDLGAAADRVWHAARLFHAGKARTIIVSGGRLPWKKGSVTEADSTSRLLRSLGVPEDAIILESRSANTRENAIETSRLQSLHGFSDLILVTSALHMQRAIASFRAAGIDPLPAATDYEVVDDSVLTPLDLLPDANALEGSSRALKEYLGLGLYRLRGWAI